MAYRRTGLRLLAGVCAMALAAPALAQTQPQGAAESGDDANEIVVTAQNRSQNVQDVPIAIDVVTAEALKKTGFGGLNDIDKIAPVVQLNQDQGTVKISVRGVGTATNDESQDTSVVVNIDGEYMNRPDAMSVALFDMDRGTRSVGLDEKIDLARHVPSFRAFLSDRIFRFAVEGHGYEWGLGLMPEAELRTIHGLDADHVFSLDQTDSDLIIDDDGEIDLEGRGSERLNVVRRPEITITVNSRPVTISRGWHDGADIKATAIAQQVNIKPDFTLDLEEGGGNSRIIGDRDRLFLRGGEHFGALDNHEDS